MSASMRRSGSSTDFSEPGALERTTARTTSWPSLKISAPTATLSPMLRFAAKRPQSIIGFGATIWMRGGAVACLLGGMPLTLSIRVGS